MQSTRDAYNSIELERMIIVMTKKKKKKKWC
jgi:hypothetical protein